jgi:hypothetical protein
MEYIQGGKLIRVKYAIKVGESYLGEGDFTESLNLVKSQSKAMKFNPDGYKKGHFEALMAKTYKTIVDYGVYPKIIMLKEIVEFQEQEVWFANNSDETLKLVKVEGKEKEDGLANAVRHWSDKMDVKKSLGDEK